MQRLIASLALTLLVLVVCYSDSSRAQEKKNNSSALLPADSSPLPSSSDGQQQSKDAQDAKSSWTYSTYQGKVSAVLDGNTIILLVENKKLQIRLLGIGAPEKGETFADKSRDNLSKLLNNQLVEVLAIPPEANQNGQPLFMGKVILQGQDVGLEQIRNGCGWLSREFENYQTQEDRLAYAEAEKGAAEKRLGLWSDSYRCKGDTIPLTTNPQTRLTVEGSKGGGRGAGGVQGLIDESGKVISAKALCGHPLLQRAGVKAAYAAKFTPTVVSGSPVKVTGVITYKFVGQ